MIGKCRLAAWSSTRRRKVSRVSILFSFLGANGWLSKEVGQLVVVRDRRDDGSSARTQLGAHAYHEFVDFELQRRAPDAGERRRRCVLWSLPGARNGAVDFGGRGLDVRAEDGVLAHAGHLAENLEPRRRRRDRV